MYTFGIAEGHSSLIYSKENFVLRGICLILLGLGVLLCDCFVHYFPIITIYEEMQFSLNSADTSYTK